MSQDFKFTISAVRPPSVRWQQLDNYDLANLEHDFEIAEFERQTYRTHLSKLIDNILKNQMYNICLHVLEHNKKWLVIDGQHRIKALKEIRDRYGLKRYNLMLAIHTSTYGREKYRILNLGKRLTSKDLTKALDTGNVEFFNRLRDYLDHYRQWDKLSFADILFSYEYVVSGKESGAWTDLEKLLETISSSDIKKIVTFCKAMNEKYQAIWDQPLYRVSVFRPLFKYVLKNNLNETQIKELAGWLEGKSEIKELSHSRRIGAFLSVEKILASRR